MKRMVKKVHFRAILPLLFIAVVFTFPSMGTGSKYMWENNIDIMLKVSYPEQTGTSIRTVGYSSEFWGQGLMNIQATSAAEGLILTAEAGYILPEYITVEIGQRTYFCSTDGAETAERISFDPVTGLLSIEESLITENPGGIMVKAAAVPENVPGEDISSDEGPVMDEGILTGVETPASEEKPADEEKPAGQEQPIEGETSAVLETGVDQ